MKKVAILPNLEKDKQFTVTKRLVNYLLHKNCEPMLTKKTDASNIILFSI